MHPSWVTLGDLNGDDTLDLVLSNVLRDLVSVLVNASNGNSAGQVYSINQVAPSVTINQATGIVEPVTGCPGLLLTHIKST